MKIQNIKCLLISLLTMLLMACTGQKVDITGFNFSSSKDDILVNKGSSEMTLVELSTFELEFKSQVELNQEIILEINFGTLNPYLSPPLANGKTTVKLSPQQTTAKLSLAVTTIPALILANEFKISITPLNSTVELSTSELLARIDSSLPTIELQTINGVAPNVGATALNNAFKLSGKCSGNNVTIHARNFLGLEIPLLNSAGTAVKCMGFTWQSQTLDVTTLLEGTNTLSLVAVDAVSRESSLVNFTVIIDTTAPSLTGFTLDTSYDGTDYYSNSGTVIPQIKLLKNSSGNIDAIAFSSGSNSSKLDNLTANSNLAYKMYITLNPDGKTGALAQKTLTSVFANQISSPADFTTPLMDGTYYVGLEVTDASGNSTIQVNTLKINSSAFSISYISTDTLNGTVLKAGGVINLFLHLNKELATALTIDSTPKLNLLTGFTGRQASYIEYSNIAGKGVIKFSYTVQNPDDITELKIKDFYTGASVFKDIYGTILSSYTFLGSGQQLHNATNSVITVRLDTVPPANPILTLFSPATSPSNILSIILKASNVVAGVGDSIKIFTTAGCSTNLHSTHLVSASPQPISINGLTANTTYAFYAQAIDAGGNTSDCVSPVGYITENTVPTFSFASSNMEINSHREIKDITWTSADADLDKFKIALGDNIDGYGNVIDNIVNWTAIGLPTAGGISYKYTLGFTTLGFDLALINGTTYYVGLRAIDIAGNITENKFQVLVNISQHAYVKSFKSESGDQFGTSVDIDSSFLDGTMVVGAPYEDSDYTGVCNLSAAPYSGNLTYLKSTCDGNAYASDAGAVYVYRRPLLNWQFESLIKSPISRTGDNFGFAVSLDGDRIAVGAPLDAADEVGITTNLNLIRSYTAPDSGAVYIYTRSGSIWSLEAIIKASNNGSNKKFGHSLKLKGNFLVVGAPGISTTTGSAYVYHLSGGVWTELPILIPADVEAGDLFGTSVALNTVGTHIAVGSPHESSSYSTIQPGDNTYVHNNSKLQSGMVYSYIYNGTNFDLKHRIKASNSDSNDHFGEALALSGNTLVVGAPYESSNQSTITNGTLSSNDNGISSSGAAYVYLYSASTWSQEAYLKARDSAPGNFFGKSISIAGDKILVGQPNSDDQSKKLGNNTSYDSPTISCGSFCNYGAAYLFSRSAAAWSQVNYLKAANAYKETFYGRSVAIDVQGNIAISSPQEESDTDAIINGDYGAGDVNSFGGVPSAGAVYIYKK